MKEDNEAASNEEKNTEATVLETIEVLANAQGIESSALTDKQKRFVMLIASGEVPSLVEAYIQAGYGQGTSNRKALRDNASQLASSPTVELAIQAARERIEAKSHAALYASRRWILRRLREEANDASSPASARIAALSLLAKASGALDSANERSDKREQQTRESLVAELTNRLEAIAGSEVIDVTPSDPLDDNALVVVDDTATDNTEQC